MTEIIDVCQNIAYWLFMLVYQWVILQPSFFERKKTVSLDFDEEKAREGRQGNFKISQMIPFISIRRRYMAEILPIRRKTLYNQSINQSIN